MLGFFCPNVNSTGEEPVEFVKQFFPLFKIVVAVHSEECRQLPHNSLWMSNGHSAKQQKL